MGDTVNRRAGYSTITQVTDSERVPNMKGPAAEVTAFVIAWSAAEPERIGEVAIIPDFGTAQELGRGPGEAGDARLRFFRQRPASMIEASWLTSIRVDHLAIERRNFTYSTLNVCSTTVASPTRALARSNSSTSASCARLS